MEEVESLWEGGVMLFGLSLSDEAGVLDIEERVLAEVERWGQDGKCWFSAWARPAGDELSKLAEEALLS